MNQTRVHCLLVEGSGDEGEKKNGRKKRRGENSEKRRIPVYHSICRSL